jgi:hypothetical protein
MAVGVASKEARQAMAAVVGKRVRRETAAAGAGAWRAMVSAALSGMPAQVDPFAMRRAATPRTPVPLTRRPTDHR